MDLEGESPSERDLEDAVWNLEAALNYEFRHVLHTYGEISYTVLNLDFDNGTVSGSDIKSAFDNIKDATQDILTENSSVVAIDISMPEVIDSENKVEVVVAVGNYYAPTFYQNVGDWMSSQYAGSCAGNSSTASFADAGSVVGAIYNYRCTNKPIVE